VAAEDALLVIRRAQRAYEDDIPYVEYVFWARRGLVKGTIVLRRAKRMNNSLRNLPT
jgi:hypothetical protein